MRVVWHGAAAGFTVLQQVRHADHASRYIGGVQAGHGARRCEEQLLWQLSSLPSRRLPRVATQRTQRQGTARGRSAAPVAVASGPTHGARLRLPRLRRRRLMRLPHRTSQRYSKLMNDAVAAAKRRQVAW